MNPRESNILQFVIRQPESKSSFSFLNNGYQNSRWQCTTAKFRTKKKQCIDHLMHRGWTWSLQVYTFTENLQQTPAHFSSDQIQERFPVWRDRTLTVDVMRRNWGCDDWRWKLKSHGGPGSSGAHTHTSRTQMMQIDMSVHSVWMVFVGVWHPCCRNAPSNIDIK